MNTKAKDVRAVFVCDLKLAATLITLGVKRREPKFVERVSRNGEPPKDIFYFEASQLLADYIAAWEAPADSYLGASGTNKDHPLANREHPFWYIRAVLRNRERMLDFIKNNNVLHLVDQGGKTFVFTRPPPQNL